MAAKAIPDGYSSVTPYLVVDGADRAIDFYKQAFGASEAYRLDHEGKVAHAELKIGNSMIMIGEPMPNSPYRDPISIGGSPVGLMIYVEDVDTVYQQAIAAGAREVRAVEDQFYGDRSGNLRDPFGHLWTVATHVEDVSPEEVSRRFAETTATA
jgi:PhnB protein